jgi:excinuclease ABC subunit B
MYADHITRSMQAAINETDRRRNIQGIYNKKHGIIPESIKKEITQVFAFAETSSSETPSNVAEAVSEFKSLEDIDAAIHLLEKEMNKAAKALEFERAADLRDRIRDLRKSVVFEK